MTVRLVAGNDHRGSPTGKGASAICSFSNGTVLLHLLHVANSEPGTSVTIVNDPVPQYEHLKGRSPVAREFNGANAPLSLGYRGEILLALTPAPCGFAAAAS